MKEIFPVRNEVGRFKVVGYQICRGVSVRQVDGQEDANSSQREKSDETSAKAAAQTATIRITGTHQSEREWNELDVKMQGFSDCFLLSSLTVGKHLWVR
jgi:hypothetical protein